jgi:hypothetical protein
MRVRGLERVVNEAEVTAVAGGREAALECTHEGIERNDGSPRRSLTVTCAGKRAATPSRRR